MAVGNEVMLGGSVLQGTALAPSKSIMLCLMKEMKWLYFYFPSGCVMWCCVSASQTCCLGMYPEWSVWLKASSIEKIMLSLIGHCFGIKTWHPFRRHLCPVDCSLGHFLIFITDAAILREKARLSCCSLEEAERQMENSRTSTQRGLCQSGRHIQASQLHTLKND